MGEGEAGKEEEILFGGCRVGGAAFSLCVQGSIQGCNGSRGGGRHPGRAQMNRREVFISE